MSTWTNTPSTCGVYYSVHILQNGNEGNRDSMYMANLYILVNTKLIYLSRLWKIKEVLKTNTQNSDDRRDWQFKPGIKMALFSGLVCGLYFNIILASRSVRFSACEMCTYYKSIITYIHLTLIIRFSSPCVKVGGSKFVKVWNYNIGILMIETKFINKN